MRDFDTIMADIKSEYDLLATAKYCHKLDNPDVDRHRENLRSRALELCKVVGLSYVDDWHAERFTKTQEDD